MPRQISYTDVTGSIYPSSFWQVEEIEMDRKNKRATIVFRGYKDSSSTDKMPINEKSYFIDDGDYDTYFSDNVLMQTNVCPITQAENYADATYEKDTDKSFFDGAIKS